MKITQIFSILIFPLTVIIIFSGCATMNRSECQVANWEIIGLEDASSGKPSSYIGRHREACAEHGFSPNLNLYLKGYNRGLLEFCTQQNGYNWGFKGKSNPSICKGEQAIVFNSGYKNGFRLFKKQQSITQLKNEISQLKNEQSQMEDQIKQNETAIIASNTTSEDRRALLSENKRLADEIEKINHAVDRLESQLFRLEEQR